MSNSIYRTALQVSPERIAGMQDDALSRLMGQLLRSHAFRCGAPVEQVLVNAEGRAKDDGCDGWSPRPPANDRWLGSVETCWQFKARSAGQPARLVGEVTKPIPRRTLEAGGRFVVVANNSVNGVKGENDRRTRLIDDANGAGIPSEAIEVIGSERLTNWCNEHPAIAAQWAGHPAGLWTLDDWAKSQEHQVTWQTTDATRSEIRGRQADLDFANGSVTHLHIRGQPGVGKTRFSLELCRSAPWHTEVIYIQQASDHRLAELLDEAAADPAVRLLMVADEVQPEHIRSLSESAVRANGRIRLVTIGHSPSPEPARIPELLVTPLDDQSLERVIAGWHPSMPREHRDFVVRFSAGYVRLARLAAYAVSRNPEMDVRGLLGLNEIRLFLDGMLGPGDRVPLYVVAVLESVGWTEEVQPEGEAVARHLGLDWNSVRAVVDEFHRQYSIAPRGGRYRYISPTPLAIHLAVEAWTTFPDLMRSLPAVLPTDSARDAYYERLMSIASNPHARKFAQEELSRVFSLPDFTDGRSIKRWSALSGADPDEAARNILRALSDSTTEDGAKIAGQARREAVFTLVRLAWRSSTFHNAAKSLGLLAEAENETWANNASGEFCDLFQLVGGGTAAPYRDRLIVLDELLAERPATLRKLAIKALSKIGSRTGIRIVREPIADEVPETEWRPRTRSEYVGCVESALTRLTSIASVATPDIEAELLNASNDLAMLLRDSQARSSTATFIRAIHERFPATREALRRQVARVAQGEKKYWKELSEQDLAELDAFCKTFEGASLEARLQQYVGPSRWDQEEPAALKSIAQELLSNPSLLSERWAWLTSGEAGAAWELGQALSDADRDSRLNEVLTSSNNSGPDLRLVCGYVSGKLRELGRDWFDAWVESQIARRPKPANLLIEVMWRCGATERLANEVALLLRGEGVSPYMIGHLAYGRWADDVQLRSLEAIVRALIDIGRHETAIGIVDHWRKSHQGDMEGLKSVALSLVTTKSLIRGEQMTSYHWKEVALSLVVQHPVEIAVAIFNEQTDRNSGSWFAEHSDAAEVLLACVERDPTGVWSAMLPHLSSPETARVFTIGFPQGILGRIPAQEIGTWIGERPEERASIVAPLVGRDLSTDDTLASRILGEYGDDEQVGSAFFSEYLSGAFMGPSSLHWDKLADTLDAVVSRTALPKLRRWAMRSAKYFREAAERDRQREEEEQLRGR